MGYLVLAGLFEPGTQVKLFEIDDGTLRVGAGALEVGHRLTDAAGSVGFDGVTAGQRFLAQGVQFGGPQEVRCVGLAAGDVNEIAQAPIASVPQNMGTQESKEPAEPAAVPGDLILQVGIPTGVPFGAST